MIIDLNAESSSGGFEDRVNEAHRRRILESAITPEVAAARGYQSITAEQARALNFPDYQCRPGLLIPVYGPSGDAATYQLRPDSPRVNPRQKPIKYETLGGSRVVPDFPLGTYSVLDRSDVPLWITEGVFKGDAIRSAGAWAIALLGVWNFRGRNAHGGKQMVAEFERVNWTGRLVYIAFDSDARNNPQVALAMTRVGALLTSMGADVRWVQIPSHDGAKVGIDDYLAAGGTLADLVANHIAHNPPYVVPAAPIGVTIEVDGEARSYALTELGNAERLVDLFGSDLKWCHTMRKWLVWDGRRWEIDEHGGAQICRRAQEIARALLVDAANATDSEARKKITAWAERSQQRRVIENAVEIAKTLPGIAISVDALDSDVNLLNVQNGTVDLRTGLLRSHDRGDLITKIIDFPYDPNAPADRFEKFLDEIFLGDEELTRYVAKAAGYSLTGEIGGKCFFFLYGASGDNGKTQFLEILRGILGPYAKATAMSTLLEKAHDGVGNDIATLRDARFITATEAPGNRRFDSELLKRMTGDDVIAGRFLYGEYFNFMCRGKLWIAGNDRPKLPADDKATWRRVRMIPFKYQVPIEKQERGLAENLLREEGAGILNYLIDACQLWREEGLIPPAVVRDATNEYREDTDELGEFLRQCTAVVSGIECQAITLYATYERWAKANGIKAMTNTSFGRSMVKRGFERTKTRYGAVYHNLSVVEQEGPVEVYRG